MYKRQILSFEIWSWSLTNPLVHIVHSTFIHVHTVCGGLFFKWMQMQNYKFQICYATVLV